MAFPFSFRNSAALACALTLVFLAGCRTAPRSAPGDGDIIVAGKHFATGTRVVTWLEDRSYNGYAGQTPGFGRRALDGKKAPDRAPTLAELQRNVDQFMLHYDECGLSKICFDVLQKRSLSVHFLLDLDGTVYQTLDLQERAWHATTSNDRSVGIEIANIGAYAPGDTQRMAEWYQRNAAGQVRLVPPLTVGNPRFRTPNFLGRPLRPDPVKGRVHGRELAQYDLTPEQYAALIKLTAALHRVFPKIKLDYPRDAQGRPLTQKLPAAALQKFSGVIGHFHIQENKIDPGPAFQWDLLINGAKRAVKEPPKPPSGQKPGRPGATR